MNDLDTSFFNLSTVKLPVHAGDLLVAEPFLDDKWFGRSVVSVISYDKDAGATGLVLNRPSALTLDDVLDGVGSNGSRVRVYNGGPLGRDRLFFVHNLGPELFPGALEYVPGLWIGGDFDKAVDYINDGYPAEGFMRFFAGYSSWQGHQLDDELDGETWAVMPAGVTMPQLLCGDGDAYWQRAVKTLGKRYRSWQLIPADLKSN